MNSKRVIVVGSTGSLGVKIVAALQGRGAEVTAMVRATSDRSRLEALGIKSFVVADMMNKASLVEALTAENNYDAIVASAAGYTKNSPKTDTIGYRNLVEAVKEVKIPRFVFISILESDKAVNVPHSTTNI